MPTNNPKTVRVLTRGTGLRTYAAPDSSANIEATIDQGSLEVKLDGRVLAYFPPGEWSFFELALTEEMAR